MATDIALAIGVIALLGSRIPAPVRLFLLALAIVDDIGAILVIAVFYSGGVEFAYLGLAATAVAAAVAARRLEVRHLVVYATFGTIGWYGLYKAGVHPTLIGVVFGLLAPSVPVRTAEMVDVEELTEVSSVEAASRTVDLARESVSVVEWLEHRLHGWVSFGVVPLFALANTGVPVSADTLNDAVTSPLGLGIIAGLVIGKPLGIVAATWLAVRLGLGPLPNGATWRMVAGVGSVAGIGFTVALFVTELAIEDEADIPTATLAVLIASLVAAVAGVIVLTRRAGRAPSGA
jgi:NhaA family Na+:H+ antiporter